MSPEPATASGAAGVSGSLLWIVSTPLNPPTPEGENRTCTTVLVRGFSWIGNDPPPRKMENAGSLDGIPVIVSWSVPAFRIWNSRISGYPTYTGPKSSEAGSNVRFGAPVTWSAAGTVTSGASGSLVAIRTFASYRPPKRSAASKTAFTTWLPPGGTVPEVGRSEEHTSE